MRSHAFPQPDENADDAAIRCRSPVVHCVGHLEQNAIWSIGMGRAKMFNCRNTDRKMQSYIGKVRSVRMRMTRFSKALPRPEENADLAVI